MYKQCWVWFPRPWLLITRIYSLQKVIQHSIQRTRNAWRRILRRLHLGSHSAQCYDLAHWALVLQQRNDLQTLFAWILCDNTVAMSCLTHVRRHYSKHCTYTAFYNLSRMPSKVDTHYSSYPLTFPFGQMKKLRVWQAICLALLQVEPGFKLQHVSPSPWYTRRPLRCTACHFMDCACFSRFRWCRSSLLCMR